MDRTRLAAITEDLAQTIGKVLVEMGEDWRIAHPELLDSYEAYMQYTGEDN